MVLVIVAVLVALGVPGIKRSMDSVKQGVCASNLRQIGSGLMLYASDNEGVFPIDNDPAKASLYQGAFWSSAIWTYVGYKASSFQYPENDVQGNVGADKNLFHCPVTKRYPKGKFKEIAVPLSYNVANRLSYAMNNAPSRTLYGVASTPMRMGQIKSPANTALVLEMHENGGNQWAYHNAFGLIPHRGGSNVLFYDGHVSWMSYKEIPPDKDYSDANLSPFWSGN